MGKPKLLPGACLEKDKAGGFVKHHLVYVGPIGPKGEDVIHNTPGQGVHLDYLDKATDGGQFEVKAPAPLTRFERFRIIWRALSQVGRPWTLLRNNCENTATFARTGSATSLQVKRFVMRGLISGFVVGILLAGSSWLKRLPTRLKRKQPQRPESSENLAEASF